MVPAHIGVALALGRAVAEVAPPVDHLFGRAPADAQLQAASSDQVGRAGILGHVERVLVAHVDDRRADLDPTGLGAHGGPAAGKVRQAGGRSGGRGNRPPSAPRSSARDGEIDRLQQGVGGGAGLRLRRRRPMPEREEADLFHGYVSCPQLGCRLAEQTACVKGHAPPAGAFPCLQPQRGQSHFGGDRQKMGMSVAPMVGVPNVPVSAMKTSHL